MASLFASLAPKAEFSFADVVDEVHKLRAVNASLLEEKRLLHAQVALLSEQRLGAERNGASTEVASTDACIAADAPATDKVPAVADAPALLLSARDEAPGVGTPASKPEEAAGSMVASLRSLRSELANNLGADVQQAGQGQVHALMEQLSAARAQVDALDVSHGIGQACLRKEVATLEADADAFAAEGRLRVDQLRSHCEELEVALRTQTQLAQHAQQAALAAARVQSAARISALEDSLAALQEEMAQRELLLDDFGAEPQLQHEISEKATWIAKCQLKEQDLQKVREELATVGMRHAAEVEELRRGTQKLEQDVASARLEAEESKLTTQQFQAQTERANEALNKQGDEIAGLRAQISRLEAAQADMIEKRAARAWIVNYVENEDKRPELLRLMASWWDFGQEDMLRVGLSDEAPPSSTRRLPSGLSDAFALFLDYESEPVPSTTPQRNPNMS